jgi:Domain of unknown function (DUF4091)/Family of unknown function (DUF6067)
MADTEDTEMPHCTCLCELLKTKFCMPGQSIGGPLLLCFLLLNSLIHASPAKAPVDIWTVADCVRINPQTNKAYEDNTVYDHDLKGNYRDQNSVWDRSQNLVRLFAGRNEVVAFQIVLETAGLSGIQVLVGDLRHSKTKNTIPSRSHIEVFREWYVEIKKKTTDETTASAGHTLGLGWYPDALVPIHSGSGYGQPFQVPDKLNPVPGEKSQAFWVDIYVPKSAEAGLYRGKVQIQARKFKKELNLQLQVKDFSLSDKFYLTADLNNYGGISLRGAETKLRYYQMAQKHRLTVSELYFAPKVEGEGREMHVLWEDYDRDMSKYLTGEAFTAKYGYVGPGESIPLVHLILPFEILQGHAWPMDGKYAQTERYNQAIIAVLRDFEKHFNEKGWTKTKPVVFYQGMDEPKTERAFDQIRYFGDLLKFSKTRTLKYRTDLNQLNTIGQFIDGWDTSKIIRSLGDVVDIWCCTGDFRRTNFDVLLPRCGPPHHEEAWFYQNREPSVGAVHIDEEGIGFRTWPWIAWKYGLQGCVYWEIMYYGQSNDPWLDPDSTTDPGKTLNGTGYLSYPPKPGVPEPIASIRLKSFRRGSQDYEYLRLLAEKGEAQRGKAEQIVRTVLFSALHKTKKQYGEKGDWSHNPEDWEKARLMLADELEKR